MSGRYKERSLLDFQKSFATNEACTKHLADLRWDEGFACTRCGHDQFWLLAKRGLFDCKQCRYRTSVTAGTIFHKTRTPLIKWYWLLYHMAMDKVGVSVAEMQRLLEIRHYKTAWLMGHKIRKAMADRDARYQLAGLVEMDETFFGPRGERRGRGSERKTTVLCAVSLYRDRKGQERPGFAHMRVVANASTEAIEDFLDRLGCGAQSKERRRLMEAIRSDGWRSYSRATKNKNLAHYKVVLRDPKAAGKLLPWIHRVITNAKDVIGGTHRGVSDKHLESYLSEICYRFNRRYWEKELFDRLVRACVTIQTVTYNEVIRRPFATRTSFGS